MSLRVDSTTDGKYVGTVFPVDPLNPPAEVVTPDGARFEPLQWVELGGGRWRIRNANYCVLATEVAD